MAENPELDALFRKYESAPDSYVFAPLADAYRKSGMMEEAVEICRKGLRKHPEYPSGHVVQGKCHFDVGELDDAERCFQKVLELDENNLVALKFLGMIQAGRGLLDKAGEYFKNILALDPDNREIMGMLEDIKVAQDASESKDVDVGGGDDEPVTEVEPVTDDEPVQEAPVSLDDDAGTSDDLATTTLADIYAAQGFTAKAAKIYREVLRQQPANTVVRRKLEDLVGEEGFSEIEEPEPPAPVESEWESASTTSWSSTTESVGKEEPETEDEEAAEPQDSPAAAGAQREDATEAAELPDPARQLNDKKSYEQFRRWIKNIQS